MRYGLIVVVTAAMGFANPSKAEDVCSALRGALQDVSIAGASTEAAVGTVSSLKQRLGRVPEAFGTEAEGLASPDESLREASRQLQSAIQAITDLNAKRCPDIPQPYVQ